MLAPKIAFVDLETTGGSPNGDRITEVGIVRVEHGELVEEWSQLVNPGCSIPRDIQFLTGISNDMVRDAPRFAEIAEEVAEKLHDAVFVAHNARFDFGFLKAELGRVGIDFRAKTLCTVRLSRRLFPDRGPHSLDGLIARHNLPVTDRHRALGDARVLWAFVQTLYLTLPAADIEQAVDALLQRPSLPPQLDADVLSGIPHAPGVYRFYGLNAHPIYIGKSIDLRERVGSHFTNDYRSARELRLAQEVARIEWEETAGELGALLKEANQVKTLLPAHNVRLRRQEKQIVLAVDDGGRIRYLAADDVPLDALPQHYGPFSSRASARAAVTAAAAEHGYCLRLAGVERGVTGTPCFNRQLKRCAGACIGAEDIDAHKVRLATALAGHAIPPWPYQGAVAIIERSPSRLREDWHVVDRWCFLGTVGNLDAALDLARNGQRQLELDYFKLLRAAFADTQRTEIQPLG